MTVDPTRTSVVRTTRRGPRSLAGKILRNPLGLISAVFVGGTIILGVLGPTLAPYDPNLTDLGSVNAPPFSEGHLLGADSAGRDIFSRLLWGTQQTMLACLIILTVSLAVGATAGLFAGYYRGPFETGASWVADVIMSMPGIVLLIALYALTGPNLPVAMAVFGLLVAPGFYRLVRALVLGVRGELYVDAARVSGLSDSRIIGRHILFAVRPPLIVQASFVLAAGIGIEAAVGFLGLGDPRSSSWGSMLQEAFRNIYNNGIAVLWPSLLIGISTLAFVLFGTALRDAVQQTGARTLGRRDRRRPAFTLADGDPGSALLSVSGLRIGYPNEHGDVTEVVHGVDLSIARGEVRGLVGESGSGKSQTAFAVLGLLPPEAVVVSGSVFFDGVQLLGDKKALARVRGTRISYIPQEPMSNLDPSFTVGAQLVQGLRSVRRISRRAAKARVLELLASVGIRDAPQVYRMYPHQISGGMAQRVLICGALAGDPDLIIADEPTTALDVTVQAEVLELLRELRAQRGLAVLLVSHNFGVIADLCDSVSVMREGTIVESGDVEAIFSSPRHPYTQELLAATRKTDLEEVPS